MWLFGINGLFYVLYTLFRALGVILLPGRHAIRDAWHVLLHDLHLRRERPSQGKYNAAQQIAYTSSFSLAPVPFLPALPSTSRRNCTGSQRLLGGYEFARFLHFWLTMGYVVFFVIHVVEVAIAGWNNFRGMVAGFELVRAAEGVNQKEQR